MPFPSGFGGYLPRANMAIMARATKMKSGGASNQEDKKPPKRPNWLKRIIHILFKK